ncbi:MAG: hypothetical protein IKB02_05445 [Clostridia bacterium]|nr:hypothetical protein [Clostridia bacterium]
MTLLEFKKTVLGLIEELNPNSELLTDDPDIAAKINSVINLVMFEMARMKKIPKYVELEVTKGDLITFEAIEKECGYEVYQVGTIGGVAYSPKADGTVFKVLESGTAEINCYVFPEQITEKTKDKAYEFELTPDVLGVMVYGVAGDLLKSDVSAEYGRVYSERYESKKQMLDPRYQMTTVYIEGGIDI